MIVASATVSEEDPIRRQPDNRAEQHKRHLEWLNPASPQRTHGMALFNEFEVAAVS